ncbi:26S proteasome non-ATPase regulatory subunit 6-like protein [Diplonema papillatum]|nr:26S proteasome non-ATPase regulatory subunit 6-like protein [Diplonema papillatum]
MVLIDDIEKEEEVVEEKVPVDPLLLLLQWRFEYTSEHKSFEDKDKIQSRILEEIEQHDMAPYYQFLYDSFMWPIDEAKMTTMKENNKKKFSEFEDRLKDAEENYGETEVRDVIIEQTNYCARIGAKDECLKFNKQALATGKVGLGPKLDLAFQRIRLGFAFNDPALIQEGIDAANDLLRVEGDWERRNRLKVYEGVYLMSKRQFNKAANLLLDALSAFSAPELIEYKNFILYTTLVAIVTLDRPALKKKVLQSSEVLQVFPQLPHLKRFVHSLYDCKYSEFFPALSDICEEMLQHVYTASHVNYFYREMRLIAIKQFLQSYRSVTLQSMAEAFSLPIELLDHQLSIFIASGRLSCKVDKVSGSVETAQTDSRSFQYQQLLKEGDILLNRVQRLARAAEK